MNAMARGRGFNEGRRGFTPRRCAEGAWPRAHTCGGGAATRGGLGLTLLSPPPRSPFQLSRLSLSRPNDPHPALPPPGSPWAAVQAAHAVLRGLHLHLDWASRALVLLRNRL